MIELPDTCTVRQQELKSVCFALAKMQQNQQVSINNFQIIRLQRLFAHEAKIMIITFHLNSNKK
jgi:hypothetical protein